MFRKFASSAAGVAFLPVLLFGLIGCVNEQEQLKLFAANAEEVDTGLGVLNDVDAENAEVDSQVGPDLAPDTAQPVDTVDAVAPEVDNTDAQDASDIESLDVADAVDTAVPCTPNACDDSNECTDDKCADNSCVHLAITGACDDGDGCTVGDK